MALFFSRIITDLGPVLEKINIMFNNKISLFVDLSQGTNSDSIGEARPAQSG